MWAWRQETTSLLESTTANSSMSLEIKFCWISQNCNRIVCYCHGCLPLFLSSLPLLIDFTQKSKLATLPGRRVDHVKPVVCSSCLDNDDKASLSQAMAVLGGKLVNTWSQDCTHLVMTSAKVTIKVSSTRLLSPCCLVKRLCPWIGAHSFLFLDNLCPALLSPHREARVLLRVQQSHSAEISPS